MKFFRHYSEVKKLKPAGIRGLARDVALNAFCLMEKWVNRGAELNKPRVQFVYLHHVFEDEEEGFRSLLNILSQQYTFISYSEAISKIIGNKVDKPYLSFSFDDGFKNNLRAAAILETFGVSGCFFINPGIVGETDFNKIERHCRVRLNFPPVEFMNWNDVEDLMNRGHEIGSHTMNHINVANATPDDFEMDCMETFRAISEKCGQVKHFAYPYGRYFHFNRSAKDTVLRAGFTSCASAERGCHVLNGEAVEADDLFIRRDHIILDWKPSHIQFFLNKNARNASKAGNFYPTNLSL